jgi:hypothetical protein
VNPGGHVLNNNGAGNGNAWWKHEIPGTSQVVTEEIESRSHNEFYDVFKDGQYVGSYQMSADAEHVKRDGYTLYIKPGNSFYRPHGRVDPVDEWRLTNVLVEKRPPEPPSSPSDSPDLNDDQNDTEDQTSDDFVQINQDDFDQSQNSQESQTADQNDLASPASLDLDTIAQALKTASNPDQAAADDPDRAISGAAQLQTETPTPEQLADALTQLAGAIPQQGTPDAQTARQLQEPVQALEGSNSSPTSAEIAAATEQVIASAPQVEPPVLREEPAKLDDQDPFRENPPVSTSSSEESLSSEEVLAEEPSQPVDQQQDDDLPPLT